MLHLCLTQIQFWLSIPLHPDSQYQGIVKRPTTYVLQCVGLWKICTWWMGAPLCLLHYAEDFLVASPSKEVWLCCWWKGWQSVDIKLLWQNSNIVVLLFFSLGMTAHCHQWICDSAWEQLWCRMLLPQCNGQWKYTRTWYLKAALFSAPALGCWIHPYVTEKAGFASDLLVQKHGSHCHPALFVKAFPPVVFLMHGWLRSVAAVATMNEKSPHCTGPWPCYSFCATYFEYICYTTHVDCPKVRIWSNDFVHSTIELKRIAFVFVTI